MPPKVEQAIYVDRIDSLESELKSVKGQISRHKADCDMLQQIARVGTWEWNVVDKTAEWSDELYRIYGVRKGEFYPSPDNFLSLVHPDDRAMVNKEMKAALSKEKEFDVEFRIIMPDGTGRYINSVCKTFFDETGKPLRMFGSGQDVTARKQAEEAVASEKERLFSLLDELPGFVYLQDENYNIHYANRRFRELFGDPENAHCYEVFYGQKGPCEKCPTLTALKTNTPYEWEWTSPAGRTYQLYDYPFKENGRLQMVLELGIDITGRKQVESALRESEEKFRVTFEQVAVGMMQMTLDGRFMRINQKLCDISGYSMDELMEKHISDVTFPEDYLKVKKLMEDLITGDINTFFGERRYVKKDGSTLWVNLSVSLVSEDGIPRYFIGAVQDISGRKAMEQALRKSERFLQNVFDGIQDGISVLDKDLNIIRTNKTMERLYKDMLPLVGKKCYKAYHCRTDPCPFCPNIKAMKEKKMTVNLVPREYASKTIVWQEVYSFPLFDDKGEVIGVIDIIRDVTGRKKAEEALKNSEAKFKAIFEYSGPAIFIADVKTGMIIECNSNAEEMVGLPRNEIIGLHQSMLHPKGEEETYKKIFDTHSQKNKIKDVEGEVQRKDGRRIPVWISAQPLLIDERDTLIGFFFDITERKKAEENLNLMRVSIDRAADQIFWVAPDASIVYVNDSACKALEYTKEELQRMHIYDIDPLYSKERWSGHWQNLKNSGSLLFESMHRDKRGKIYATEVSANYVKYGDKELNFAFVRDITERKRADEAVMKAKSESDLYIDLMGHDINNMNQITMGFLEMAELTIETQGKLGPENRYLLEKAIQSLHNSSNLIDNVKKLQREKRGMYKPQRIELCKMLEEVVNEFSQIPGRDVQINYKGMEGCHVNANELLRDVFGNLIGNAIKHSRDELTVNVIVSKIKVEDKKYCKVVIEDNGPGISDKLKCTIFDRLSLSSTRAMGKGFGLCLTKILIDDFGGKFIIEDRVEGDYTKGARFVVMLPSIK